MPKRSPKRSQGILTIPIEEGNVHRSDMDTQNPYHVTGFKSDPEADTVSNHILGQDFKWKGLQTRFMQITRKTKFTVVTLAGDGTDNICSKQMFENLYELSPSKFYAECKKGQYRIVWSRS